MFNELIKDKKFKEAYKEFRKLHPHDQALLLEEIEIIDQIRLLSQMKDNDLSELLTYLDAEDSAQLMLELDLSRQKNLFDQMDIDDAVDIIEEFDEEDQSAIVSILEERAQVEKLLTYNDDEAGSLMTSNFLKINEKMDVTEAMKVLIDRAPDVESISTLFVVNDDNKFVGTVNLNKLIKTKSPNKIESLTVKDPFANEFDEIDMTVHQMREYALHEMAVCNDDNEILGIITLDDAIEAYKEEAAEDFVRLAAVGDVAERNIFKSALHRLPWLLILLLASIPIALSTELFEEIILSVTILALFQPLILDASGDVATQTLAVTLRKLSQTDKADLKEGVIEVITGAINGLILGVASMIITIIIAYFLKTGDQPFMIGLVVGLSLWITVIIGPVLGFLIPVVLNKLKIDPAVASGPFITTIVDILSLIVFFGLATLMLGV